MENSRKKTIEIQYNTNLKDKHYLLVAKAQFISNCFDSYSEGKMTFKVFKKRLKQEVKAIKKYC
jgi:hypothetical protein